MPDIKKYLNRDGLEEYNSLLPHSGAEMQTYVNDWLDEHPEATTTVQDGAITEPKLADNSVSLRTLADDTVHMLKGAILTGNLSGEVLTADDAYSAPPVALAIEGKSTQDGTPTPDAPVEIVSVEQANLMFAGSNLLDMSEFANFSNWNTSQTYAGFTVNVPNGNIIIKYDGATYHEENVYLNVTTGSTAIVGGKFLAHSSSGVGNSAQSLSPVRNAITFGMHPKNAATLQKIVSNIGSTLRVILDANTAYAPYDGTNVLLNLTQALRSLPDGTKDTLALSYLRPSTREGWAWYTPTMVQNVTPIILNGILPSGGSYTDYSFNVSRSSGSPDYAYIYSGAWDNLISSVGACNKLVQLLAEGDSGSVVDTDSIGNGSGSYRIRMLLLSTRLGIDWDADTAVARTRKFNTWIVDNPITALCKLATTHTTQLEPIELPFTAAPNFTIWSDQNTNLQIEYVRDANIVIQNIEQAIADQ